MRCRGVDGVRGAGGRRCPLFALQATVVASLAMACAHRPAAVSPAACAAARTEAARQSALWEGRTLAGTVQLTVRDGLLRNRAIATVATVPPDRLRLEVGDALGQTQFLAMVDGDAVTFWSVEDGWSHEVPAQRNVPLPAAVWPYLPRLLLGLPCAVTQCSSTSTNTRKEAILLRCDHGTPRWQWDPQDRQVVGASLPPLRISYLDADQGNGLHPRDLDVDLGGGRSLSLRWQRFSFDREFPPDLFRPRQPETAPAVDPSVERP